MKIDYYQNGNLCEAYVDASTTNSLLRFSHEITITFKKKDGQWRFDSAWHIGVCEVTYESTEADIFEKDFPGLLEEVRQGIKEVA